MKLHIALSIFLIGVTECSLAGQFALEETPDNVAQHARRMPVNTPQAGSILSVPLYLPLVDDAAWSSIMTQEQLNVTPTTNLTVNNIRLTVFSSTDGTCTDQLGNTILGSVTATTVDLISGHSYVTTDASNYAEMQADAGVNEWSPATDTRYRFRNGTTLVGLPSNCIAGGGTCTGGTNCGWPATRSWAP